jgi:hypothetical protein
MRIQLGALCATMSLLMAAKAGAECVVPMAPTFGAPGTAVTDAQKRAAYDVLTQHTQQVMLFNTCAKQERTALAAQTQSQETKAALQSNGDRRKLAAEQYILAGTRYQQYAMPTTATTAMPDITVNSDPAQLIASLQGLNQGALPGQGLQPYQLQQLQLAQQMLQLQQGAGQASQQVSQPVSQQLSQQIAQLTPRTTRQAQQLQELQQMQQQLQQLQQIQPQDRNSRRNGSQSSANPVPVASASALSAAPSATGDTFKSVCWNHNLNAAELLDCGACEKQYADMLPQLNQLAAAKKQSQLNAFLGDCPRVAK